MSALAWAVWLLLAVTLSVNLVRWARREREIIAPLPICLLTIGFYVLPRAGYLLWFGRAPLTSAGLTQDAQLALITQTLLAAGIATMGVLAGYRSRTAARAGSHLRLIVPDPDPQRVLWVGGTLGLLGVAVVIYLLLSLGNISYALSHQYEMNVLLQGKQSLFQLARLILVAVVLLLINPITGKSRWWVWIAAVATAAVFIAFGYRVFVLMAIGSPIVLYHLLVRRIRLSWMITGAVAGGVALFLFGYIRLLTVRRVEQTANIFASNPVAGVHFLFNAAGELKVFDATSIVVRDVPETVPYNYGTTFVRVPWMIIPRRVWPEKPYTSGHLIVQRYLPHLRTAYPPMAVGEFFAAGGWLGVFCGFFALGWLSRTGWEWYRRHPGVGNATVYLLFCFFVFDLTRVGDPSRTIWFFLIGAVTAAFAFSISAEWSRPARLALWGSSTARRSVPDRDGDSL